MFAMFNRLTRILNKNQPEKSALPARPCRNGRAHPSYFPDISRFSAIANRTNRFRTAAVRRKDKSALLYFLFRERTPNVSKLRISVVQYLNTAPLVRGFTHGPLRGRYELSFTVPSQCAEALRSGAVDIAIIPAIEYQRIDDLVVLPDIAIAAKTRVRSLLLVSKTPVASVKHIALDRSSRSTQALTRILCAEHWKISPEFSEALPDAAAMLQQADAALLIGDPALRLAMEIEKGATGAALGLGRELHVYDIVEQWRRMTGLPAVLAIWAARPDAVTPEVLADFAASRAYGISQIAEIAREAERDLGLPAAALAGYLRDNIDFSLDAENRKGLDHYFARAAALGLIPRAKPVEWALDGDPGEAGAGLLARRQQG
jgi:chorismate dehydratase